MSAGTPTVLVVGGDSSIGKGLISKCQSRNAQVLWTTRRPRNAPGELFLDLNQMPNRWDPPGGIDLAYLCAAVTQVAECEAHAAASYRINVENTLRIATKLLEQQVFVVFPSTNYVFSDSRPKCLAEQPYSASTEYGRQKAEAEQALLQFVGDKAIVRLTKVLGARSLLVHTWCSALQGRKRISAFDDVYIAPISLKFVVESLYLIGSSKRAGIYQISGREDISYARFARLLAAKLCVPSELVQGQSCKGSGASILATQHGSLDMTETIESFGIHPQTAEAVVKDLLTPEIWD